MQEQNPEQTTRRGLLKHLSGVAAATAFPILGQNPPPESHHSSTPVTKQAATAYRYRYFSPQQLKTLEALVETIIPADEHSPGAKDAGVAEYIDAIVADAPAETKQLWREGLLYLNQAATKVFGKSYEECSSSDQTAMLREIAGDEESPESRPEQFFRVCKRGTIDGYYTSKIGIHQDLQYQGNDALPQFTECHRGELL